MYKCLNSFFFVIILTINIVNVYGQQVKYASDYGFSTSADGEENAEALQKALNGGGKIILYKESCNKRF